MDAPSLRDRVSTSSAAHASRLLERGALLGLPRLRRRALHVGCGIGTTTAALAELFDEAIGVDASASAIEDASMIHGERANLRYVVGDVEDVSVLGRFDLVYLDLRRDSRGRRDAAKKIGSLLDGLTPGGLLALRLPRSSNAPLLRRIITRPLSRRAVLAAVTASDARIAWSGSDADGQYLVYATRAPALRVLRDAPPNPQDGGYAELPASVV